MSAVFGAVIRCIRFRPVSTLGRQSLLTFDKSSRAAKPAAERTASLRRILQEWVQHPADTGSTDMPAPLVDWLAEHLGIDIVRQWTLDRSYLELLTTAQLQELAAKWKLQPAAVKRGELVEWLAEAGKEKPCPKAVRGIKAVSLV